MLPLWLCEGRLGARPQSLPPNAELRGPDTNHVSGRTAGQVQLPVREPVEGCQTTPPARPPVSWDRARPARPQGKAIGASSLRASPTLFLADRDLSPLSCPAGSWVSSSSYGSGSCPPGGRDLGQRWEAHRYAQGSPCSCRTELARCSEGSGEQHGLCFFPKHRQDTQEVGPTHPGLPLQDGVSGGAGALSWVTSKLTFVPLICSLGKKAACG